MKNAWILSAVLCLSSSVMAQDASWTGYPTLEHGATEATGSFVYFFPSQQYSGFYDRMYGVEFQYTYWPGLPLGVSVMGGVMSADVRAKNRQLIDPNIAVFKGSAQLIPIGVSGLLNVVDANQWRIDGEAGIRYVFMSSDIRVQSVATGAGEDVGQEDGVVAVLRLNVNRRVAERWSLFCGGGVQFDLSAGKISFGGEKQGDDNLKGYSLSFGATYSF